MGEAMVEKEESKRRAVKTMQNMEQALETMLFWVPQMAMHDEVSYQHSCAKKNNASLGEEERQHETLP